MLHIGDLLDNKYKILSETGHGGMSVVYLAINERANKTWAVKEVRKDGTMDSQSLVQGLVAETDLLKKLNHPHLPAIIDVIDLDDSFVIVMDFIEGNPLQDLLKSSGAQPEEKVIKWGKQLCDVLGYLHRQNPPIIYRDMKPSNVMLKPDGNVTLIDFGTAREFKNRAMVEDTTCLGTRGYAAPEQFGGRGQTDPRTDIYCLGATLYHLITGHSPAEPPYEIKPLRYWIPQYAGSGLEKVILKCTQQDPAKRYQNCAELMYDLEHYKDQDDKLQKQRRKIWRTFLAGVIIAGVGLAGTITFGLLRSSAQQDSYEYLISLGNSAENVSEAATYYKQALAVNAGDKAVYEAILDKEEEAINTEGKLTDETAKDIQSIFTSTGSGRGAYIDTLRQDDPKEYTKFMYEMGLRYFFMKGNTDADKSKASTDYFANIQDEQYSQYLSESEQELSGLLYQIGGYISKIGSQTSTFGSDSSGNENYSTLFTQLYQIATGDLKSQVGKDIYIIKIYQEIAAWIDRKNTDFSNDDVKNESMLELLKIIQTKLSEMEVSQDSAIYSYYTQAVDTVDNAIDLIGRKSEVSRE